ncbi:gamma-glutamyltranspeptidase 1-like protein, partial [Coemansia spiralis]
STLVTAKNGAVATDEARCSAIGVDILRNGGNAVDATVASALCVGVLQAHSSGIGGGGFMLIRPPGGQAPVLIDFREIAGAAATEDMFIDDIKLAQIGGLSIGVPGEIAGMYHAHHRFGKLSWRSLFEPSITLARGGFTLSELVHHQLKTIEKHILASPGFNTTYTDARGRLLKPGATVYRPALADTLEEIAEKGPSAFYKGRIAASLLKAIRNNGGILTEADFEAYRPVERAPVETFYHGRRIITGSPPTSGSILLNMLNVLEGYNLARDGQTALNYHRIVEAMKFGAAQRTFLCDPSFVDIAANITRQIDKHFAASIRTNISDTQTFDVSHYDPEYDILINHGTTHISVVDKDGLAVSATSTVNLEFGSRIMDPVTGIILNDEMDDFSTTNKTNGFGLRPSPNNKIVRGKRPLSSTSATIIEYNGEVELVLGGSGGSRILTSVLQVIVNALDFDMRLDNAVDTPRLHHQLLPNHLMVDPLFPSSVSHALAAFGHEIVPLKHGSSVVQAVRRLPNGLLHAVSDARKHGVAAGY